MTTFNATVGPGTDDACEDENGAVWTSGDLFYGNPGFGRQWTDMGFRFTNVTVPPGANISDARLGLTHNGGANIISSAIYCQAADNAPGFTTAGHNVSNRPKTSGNSWYLSTSNLTSPSIAGGVQQVVDRAGWASGNALVVLIRTVTSEPVGDYIYIRESLATLSITYTVAPVVRLAGASDAVSTASGTPRGAPFTLAGTSAGVSAAAAVLTVTYGRTGFTDYLEGKLLDYILGNVAYTIPDPLYAGLLTTTPTDDAGTGAVEVSGASYARVAVPNDTLHWTASTTSGKTNSQAISWGTAAEAWGTVQGMAFYDAASGGNLLMWDNLLVNKTVQAGHVVALPVGGLTIVFGAS